MEFNSIITSYLRLRFSPKFERIIIRQQGGLSKKKGLKIQENFAVMVEIFDLN